MAFSHGVYTLRSVSSVAVLMDRLRARSFGTIPEYEYSE